MSASKVKHEFRTMLNLGSDILTKSRVNKILRETKVQTKELNGTNTPIYIGNQINIGMYVIRLEFSLHKIEADNIDRLKDFGKFNIRIFENCRLGLKEIDLNKHSIFKQREWARRNAEDKLRISDLVEAILLCGRLDRLKAFN